MASRMESTSTAGYIQLSTEAANMLSAQDSILAMRLRRRGCVVALSLLRRPDLQRTVH